jgi:D-alanyl-D-alanine carboxypeptidase/D-alanyl-D-alanine-endopeptidase (penicillin-binding protein 4)
VLEVLGSILSLFLTPKVETLQSAHWANWINATASQTVFAADPMATAAIQAHLNGVAGLGFPAETQGLWIQSSDSLLAHHQGNTPFSAASLTKVATTLVALETWGTEHQFETVFSATGPIAGGVLQGDLVVQGSGDPLFVWEEAITVGNALTQAGINRVQGNLVITGNFTMNFEKDPIASGNLLKQGLNASLWNDEANTQYQQLTPGTPRPQIVIDGVVQYRPDPSAVAASVKPIVRHQSLPLVSLLKAMNIYSNNMMSESVADLLGGAPVVAEKASQIAGFPASEIQLTNGSGLGLDNRISPRAVTAMMLTIQRYLQPQQLNIGNIFPVAGRDGGTLSGRGTPAATVVKTGTLNEVSALAGVIPTRDRGLVWFTIINYGTGDIGKFHDQQDGLLQSLQKAWGVPSPLPPAIRPSDRASNPYNRVGSPERNTIVK